MSIITLTLKVSNSSLIGKLFLLVSESVGGPGLDVQGLSCHLG